MEKSRPLNQENWKRTQVRLPPELHDGIINYAEKNNLSLNSAMLELIDKGLNAKGNRTVILSESDSGMFSKMLEGLKQMELKQLEMANDVARLKELYPEDRDKLAELEKSLRPSSE